MMMVHHVQCSVFLKFHLNCQYTILINLICRLIAVVLLNLFAIRTRFCDYFLCKNSWFRSSFRHFDGLLMLVFLLLIITIESLIRLSLVCYLLLTTLYNIFSLKKYKRRVSNILYLSIISHTDNQNLKNYLKYLKKLITEVHRVQQTI